MDTSKKIGIAGAVIIAIILLLLNIWQSWNKPEPRIIYRDRIHVDTLDVVDTLITEVPVPRIKIKIVPEIVYVSDTVYETKPFIAMKDTILNADTLSIQYAFPKNLFEFDLRRKPLEEKTLIKYVEIKVEVEKQEPWWVHPAWAVGGAVIGFGLGRYK